MVRTKGAQFLLIPAYSFWWLDHYSEFRQHLDGRYCRILADQDCVIYRLAAPQPSREASLIRAGN
jgi:hypothetical protein